MYRNHIKCTDVHHESRSNFVAILNFLYYFFEFLLLSSLLLPFRPSSNCSNKHCDIIPRIDKRNSLSSPCSNKHYWCLMDKHSCLCCILTVDLVVQQALSLSTLKSIASFDYRCSAQNSSAMSSSHFDNRSILYHLLIIIVLLRKHSLCSLWWAQPPLLPSINQYHVLQALLMCALTSANIHAVF